MEESLKFNSQVCTNIKQSQRLLELGLNPETADMYYTEGSMDAEGNIEYHPDIKRYWISLPTDYIPAWSLHRLLYILYPREDVYPIMPSTAYDDIIDEIEDEIKCGGFNKEYLKQ